MKTRKFFLAALAAFLLLGSSLIPCDKFKFEKSETTKKMLRFPEPGQRELLVDNVFGAITVKGTNADEARLTAEKTIRAWSENRIKRAAKEVSLEIKEEGSAIDIYVSGPFRNRDRRGVWDHYPGYIVQYDLAIEIPYETDLYLRTVSHGDIQISKVNGNFNIRNVNGKIIIEEISGSGSAHTVNGKIKAAFSRNPDSDCSFKTLNGDLDLYFPREPSADFLLKTMHGNAYTEFDCQYLPVKPQKPERKGSRYIFRSGRFTAVRTGRGGPEIKMETLNGNLTINKTKTEEKS